MTFFKDQKYDKYDRFGHNFYFIHYTEAERHLKYAEILRKKFQDVSNLRMLEVGAGHGHNLIYFKSLGLSWTNIYANEILPDRVQILKDSLPMSTVIAGDALEIKNEISFDIVLQSTVFSSVLDYSKRK